MLYSMFNLGLKMMSGFAQVSVQIFYSGKTIEELVPFPNAIEAHSLCKFASWKWAMACNF